LVEQSRAGRIDLARLSIAALVDAFATALATVLYGTDNRPVTLARWGSWLVLTADLTLLRSQLLVPTSPEAAQDAQETAEALRRQVAHRAEAGALADWLEQQDQLGRDVWGRGQPEIRTAEAPGADITALFRACLPALRVPAGIEQEIRFAVAPAWSVTDALRRVADDAAESGRERRTPGTLPARCLVH
jgi:segregation and condensation protein A